MSIAYHPVLVTLSLLIGALASHVTLDLAERVSDARRGWERTAWVGGGAVAMGVGIWSVHFVGMLAFRLRIGLDAVPVGYHMPNMLLAVVAATAGAALTFVILGRRLAGELAVPLAAVAMGGGIAAAHYSAMTAMHVMAHRTHRPAVVVASVAIALTAAYVSLRLAATGRDDRARRPTRRRLGATVAMVAAIAGTHYTGMAAARFTPTRTSMRVEEGDVVATSGLSALVFIAALLILGLALVVAALDQRAIERLAAADEYARLLREAEAARADAEAARHTAGESERRFHRAADAAPVMIWVAGTDTDYEYVNAAWRDFTGRAAEQPLSGAWAQGIHPDDLQRRQRVYLAALQERRPFRVEYRRRRADGEYRWLLESGVPRFTPQGEFVGYVGSAVDVSDIKESEQAQRLLLDAARQLGTSLDVGATLRQATAVIVPGFADFCILRLVDEGGTLRQAAATHVDPDKVPLLEELGRVFTPACDEPHSLVSRVFQTGQRVLLSALSREEVRAISPDPAVARITSELGVVSSIVMPLVGRGATFGTVTFATSVSGRVYNLRDLERAEMLSMRIALAITNADLYRELREAGERAVHASQLETQLVQVRLASLRAQLNPHFLFNALNTIAMLVRRGANDDALHGVVSLSELLRFVLDATSASEAPLGDELGFIERYLALEQLRFRDRLHFTMRVDDRAREVQVPTMLLQPLVENAVRHGVAPRVRGGTVHVAARVEGGDLVLEVCDDGDGFPPGWEAAGAGGIGISATRERLRHVYGDAHRFEVRNAPGGGAVVVVRIPCRRVAPRS